MRTNELFVEVDLKSRPKFKTIKHLFQDYKLARLTFTKEEGYEGIVCILKVNDGFVFIS